MLLELCEFPGRSFFDGEKPNFQWNQPHIRSGAVAESSHWAIEVERDGTYEISLRRWPVEAQVGSIVGPSIRAKCDDGHHGN